MATQFVEPVDLVLIDTGQDVGEVIMRVEAREFCAFNKRHGISDVVPTGV